MQMSKKEEKSNAKTATDKKETSQDVQRLQAQLDEVTDLLKRKQAEFENYKKRVEKENQYTHQYAEEQLITRLLPVLDSFELSLQNVQNPEKFKQGIEYIFAQLYAILKERGLQKLVGKGKPYDPHTQEVLMTEESDQDDVVLEELQPGYQFKDKVIRHAKVKIGKKKDTKE